MSFCRNHSMTFYYKGIKRLHIYILYIYIYTSKVEIKKTTDFELNVSC